jgi:hypothetical protein
VEWEYRAKEWIDDSKDTNEYCERNLIIAALYALEKTPPNVTEAKRRLCQLFEDESGLVDVPEYVEQ